MVNMEQTGSCVPMVKFVKKGRRWSWVIMSKIGKILQWKKLEKL